MFTTDKKTLVIEINKNNKIEIKVKFGKNTHIVDFEINGELAGHLLKPASKTETILDSVWFENTARMLLELYQANSETLGRTMLQGDDPELLRIVKGHQKVVEKIMKLKAVNYNSDESILIDNYVEEF